VRIIFIALLAVVTCNAYGVERLALVIGNGAYHDAPLRNPVNDARAMADTLRQIGFSVIYEENADRQTLRQAIRDFSRDLQTSDVGLFYFAGHGMQVKGRNYLIPVHSDIQAEFEVPDEALEAAAVLRGMEDAGSGLNIVILDACRNNPFARSFRSATRGLARMDAPSGSIIAYATAPGQVALDGDGEHGIYTKHLLDAMRVPGLPIEQVFKRVRIGVRRETGGQQTPWEESSLTSDFIFTPGGGSKGTGTSTAPPSPSVIGVPAYESSGEYPGQSAEVTIVVDQSSIIPLCHPPIDILRRGVREANCDVTLIFEVDGEQIAELVTSYTEKIKDPIWTGELPIGKHDITVRFDYSRKSKDLADGIVTKKVDITSDGKLRLKLHHDSVVIEERGLPFSDLRALSAKLKVDFEAS